MVAQKHLGGGTFPDVAYFLGRWYVVWQHGPTLHLVSLWPDSLEEVSWTSWEIGAPAAHPKLLSWQGRLWLAYRQGAEPYRVVIREIGTSNIEELSVGHGSDPVALGAGDVAWQTTGAPSYEVWRKSLLGPSMSKLVRLGSPTGLSRVLPNGTVTTVDEDRLALPGYTRPCWAGDLTVAEGNQLGAYGRLSDGRELTLWRGQEAVTPRCAWDGADRFGIATWGALEGVRFAEVTRDEFQQPTQEPEQPVLDRTTVVDVLDFIPIGLALDDSHLLAFRHTGQQPNVFSIAKHPDGGGEWWAYDDHWLYHHLDQAGSAIEEVASGTFVPRYRNGSRIDAYYLADDARILPRRVKTGDQVLAVGRIYRLADGHSDPWRHTNTVEVFSTFPTPLGTGRALRWTYDPRTARDSNGRLKGRFEKFTFAIVNGRRYASWEDWRTKDDNSGDELMQQTRFTQVDVMPVVQWRLSPRPASARLLPAPQQVGMTIIEPATYPATASGNRLRAVCGPNPGEHWASWVEWIYRRVGESGWSQQGERRNPRDDQDHTFTFPGPGEYEIGLRWREGQTGRRRVVRVDAAVPQPQPPPPEPQLPASQTMQIQTNDRQHYITVSANGLATATETSADHATVQLELLRGDDGRFALRALGKVGSAQLDGTFTFDRERGADWRPDGWEALRAERSSLGGESYVTDHGTRLRAVNQGGGELRHDVRDSAGIDETFWPSVSLVGDHNGHVGGGATTPLPPADLDRIDGQLQIESGGGFVVNGRPVLPCFWHDGSLFSIFCQDEGRALRVLDEGAAAGFHGERSWDTLDGDWWSGLHVNPKVTANFWEKKRRFLLAHRDRGLVVFDSRGSMWPASIDNPHEFFSILGDVYNEVGPHVIAVSEWCNEVAGACPDERRDPRLMHECMDILRAKCPQVLQAGSAYTGMPIEVRLLDDWSRDIYLQHSSRGNRWFNMLEHAFSTPYEDRPKRRQGINSEPPARGHWVSAIDFPDDCDTDFQVLLALINWISRQGAVLFSSPGVRPDLREDITQIAGWREVPRARRLLPTDVMRYSEIFHGGAGREFSPRRVIDAGSGRAEHAYHGPDGRFVVVGYHQDRVEPFLRDVRVDLDMPIGTKGRLIVGQAA